MQIDYSRDQLESFFKDIYILIERGSRFRVKLIMFRLRKMITEFRSLYQTLKDENELNEMVDQQLFPDMAAFHAHIKQDCGYFLEEIYHIKKLIGDLK